MKETVGQRLRRLRNERGLSQRDLACEGVSYAYISRIEAGARRPSVKALRQLALKLNVDPYYLETGDESGLWVYVTKEELLASAHDGCQLCGVHATEAGLLVEAAA